MSLQLQFVCTYTQCSATSQRSWHAVNTVPTCTVHTLQVHRDRLDRHSLSGNTLFVVDWLILTAPKVLIEGNIHTCVYVSLHKCCEGRERPFLSTFRKTTTYKRVSCQLVFHLQCQHRINQDSAKVYKMIDFHLSLAPSHLISSHQLFFFRFSLFALHISQVSRHTRSLRSLS